MHFSKFEELWWVSRTLCPFSMQWDPPELPSGGGWRRFPIFQGWGCSGPQVDRSRIKQHWWLTKGCAAAGSPLGGLAWWPSPGRLWRCGSVAPKRGPEMQGFFDGHMKYEQQRNSQKVKLLRPQPNTVDGRNPGPPKKPWKDDSPSNTNKRYGFPMVSKRCEMDFVHQYEQT